MDILETIAQTKRREIEIKKSGQPASLLEKSRFFSRSCTSLSDSLRQPGSSGIIAEFKRKSPSKGILNPDALIVDVTKGYARAGAAGISVLTDTEFFGGFNEDLIRVRENNTVPILRKDFILDSYQLIEAKSIGADVILLIAAILTPRQVHELARTARDLGMETILEVHSLRELDHRSPYISIVGVNNRNLSDFKVDIRISMELSGEIGRDDLFISESGLREPADVNKLRQAGYSGFLIGEQFMASPDPSVACMDFISKLNNS
jgi:indole-3-glycerol phosphate synthase